MDQPLAPEPADTVGPQKPTFPDEYTEWLWDNHRVSVDVETETEFARFSQQLERQFRNSGFFQRLSGHLLTLHANYKVRAGTALLANPADPVLLDVKTWESFFEKTYRRNVRDNRNWPAAPDRGWVLPETWFGQIGDIVRTILVVRYLDGMDEVARSISKLAGDHSLSVAVGRIAKVDGYYATHVDIAFTPRIPVGLDVLAIPTSVEVQITTELQANIRELAHSHYERRRLKADVDPTAWQWDYRGSEFSSNYIGHVLHYLEGMIMQLREGKDGRQAD